MDELDELLTDLQRGVSAFTGSKASTLKPPDGSTQLSPNSTTSPLVNSPSSTGSVYELSKNGTGRATDENLIMASSPCFSCKRPILGPSVAALGDGIFHPDCFRCKAESCRRRLVGLPYFEMFPDIFCEGCYHERFSPKCAYCQEPIKERCISALGKSFHPEHFFCSQCGKNFGTSEPFMEADGMAYCPEDYRALFACGCAVCRQALLGDYITAAGKKYHRECFGCAVCKKSLANDGYFEHEGEAYCERDYYMLIARPCATCGGPLVGRGIKACGKNYHVDCFKCVYCKEALDVTLATPRWGGQGGAERKDAGFRVQENNPYCIKCYVKLFA